MAGSIDSTSIALQLQQDNITRILILSRLLTLKGDEEFNLHSLQDFKVSEVCIMTSKSSPIDEPLINLLFLIT